MFKNYLKIALRNFLGHKGYSFINISGLAVGIAVCIFILLWVRDELSYNRFHKNINNLYLAATQHDHGTEKGISGGAPPAVGPALEKEYPEILNAARFRPPWAEFLVRHGDKSFTEGIGFADPEFYEMFSFPFVQGNPQSPYESTYSLVMTEKVVINEQFARLMGHESPVGKLLRKKDTDTGEILRFTIMGIVKDFHYKPLDSEIGPIILFYKKSWWTKFRYFSLRIGSTEISRTLADIQGIVKKYNPAFPFEYSFLDEDYGLLYRSYERLGKIFNYFAFVAIFISCLGLFGLASFVAERKTKEIGIRRALGASVLGIVGLLSKKFLRLVIIANVIAWPLAYYLMSKWLQDFAYRTGLGVWTFILSGFIALLIALFSVSYQSFRAAAATPVKALRYE